MSYTQIDNPIEYFDTKLYTGTGASNSISGLNFAPDWVWIKGRSGATEHVLTDAVRGVTKELSSNDTGAEETVAQGLTAFNSDGFTIGTDGSYNTSSATYVGWNFKANGAGVSNTDGSITSTVSASQTSGFSIVSYTGDASGNSGTVGHGLGVSPSMIILKNRTNARNWGVWHKNLTATSNYSLILNSTDAQANDSSKFSTAPTSTVFTPGGNDGHNENGSNHIAYCFAEKKGYSKFGKYVGNGSTDGSFIYTGFKPAFVIIKQSSASGNNWNVYDNKRDIDNVVDARLLPSTSDAETTLGALDFLSNGFKLRATGPSFNGSGSTYIYMCFAESPFVTSSGVPTTAR